MRPLVESADGVPVLPVDAMNSTTTTAPEDENMSK